MNLFKARVNKFAEKHPSLNVVVFDRPKPESKWWILSYVGLIISTAAAMLYIASLVQDYLSNL